MAKKPAPRKPSVKPKDHTEEGVDVSVEIDKRNVDGSKTTTQKKGAFTEDVESSSPNSSLPLGLATTGLSKGYTVNLGNYESARINCWLTRTCKDDDTTIMNTMAEISQLLDEQLEFEVAELNASRE